MSERTPHGPDDARLDALLAQARWPAMPRQAIARLEARVDDIAALPVTRRPRRLHPAWIVAGLAAALAAGIGTWLIRDAATSPGPVAVEPSAPSDAPAPRLHHADLPGRAPTSLEMAWVLAMHQPQRAPVTRPTTAQARRQAGLELALSRSRLTPPPQPAEQAEEPLPYTTFAQALTGIETGAMDDALRAAALEHIPATLLYQRMQEPVAASIQIRLSTALAQSPDPAAPALVLKIAEVRPALARQAVAEAPRNSPAVLSLVDLLASPSVPQRESAAQVLAASDDPAVYRAIHARLEHPSSRREALMTLLMSDSDTARELINSAEANSQLRAAVLSLRAQGVAPPPRSPPQAQPQPIAF